MGGKKRLLSEISARIPNDVSSYCEPFVGGGAVLLNVLESSDCACFCSDTNEELVNFYKMVRDKPTQVAENVGLWENSKETYLSVRQMDRCINWKTVSDITRAARFAYLNASAFQGMWRTSSLGYNNVPWRAPKNTLPDVEAYVSFSSLTKHVFFEACDFSKTINNTNEGGFVYADPPYLGEFSLYAKNGFDLNDHVRLRDCLVGLVAKGGNFLLSNSDTKQVRELYSAFQIDEVTLKKTFAAQSTSRIVTKELLISSC